MKEADYRTALAEKGFDEPVLVKRDADAHLDGHTHPFEAMAYILEGEITIITEASAKTYHAGEVFHLQSNEFHREEFGPGGVTYLSGRKRL